MRGSGPRKKRSSQQPAQLMWVDSELRFVARLSDAADQGVLLRLDVRRPTAAQTGGLGADAAVSDAEDDLYLNVGEMLLLRPCGPRQSMRALGAAANPDEVTVRVEAFWSGHESGGNHGRAVRSGSVTVLGETAALGRLRGDHHVSAPGRVRDASGVRGGTHGLVGGITLRRVRNAEAAAAAGVVLAAPRWVCVDYTATHARLCPAVPRCTGNGGGLHSTGACALRAGLTLHWQTRNENDDNAIEVVAPTPDGAAGAAVVGFVPRELAACLSPALRRGLVRVAGVGVHSAPAAPCAVPHPVPRAVSGGAAPSARFRVWFQVCPVPGVHADGAEPASEALHRAPWWVESDAHHASGAAPPCG